MTPEWSARSYRTVAVMLGFAAGYVDGCTFEMLFGLFVAQATGRQFLVNSGVKRGHQATLNPAVNLAEDTKVRTRSAPARTSWPTPVLFAFGAKAFHSPDLKAENSLTRIRGSKAHSRDLEKRKTP
jgi:hypothetical protein